MKILNRRLTWEQTMKFFLASIVLSFFLAIGVVVVILMILL